MKIFKITGAILLVLFLSLGATALVARYSDGPIGIFPGGPLRGGPVFPHFIVGWGWARENKTIEMQLADDDTSRTTWFVVHEARAYIPAGLDVMPGKTWHLRADGATAWLRIEGKRYEVRLDRFEDETLIAEIEGKAERKYGRSPGGGDGEVWWFKVTSIAPIPSGPF